MGNQPGKVSVKSSKSIDFIDGKNSRTNWTAGVASSPGRPIIELSSRISAPEDDSVTDEINLTWASPEDDGGYPITGYRVEMLDIQTGKWIEVTFIEGYEPKCTLSNILYGIMYRFRVVALNDAGSSEPGEPSEPIVIDVPGVQIAPYFVQMLNDTIALEHEKVEFRVRVLGTPKPSIQWYKDDVEIFACERIEMREEDEGGAVILKGARLSDSGTIKCVATNLLGRCTSTATFSIEAAPRFDVPENYNDGLIFRHDEVIRLRVPMVAKPAPKVVWFFEDEPISAGSDLVIETQDNYTSLRIQGAKRWHCGEFRVYAENEYGEDACSILVTVTSPPSPPGRPVVIDITETKCTLKWEPSDDDGGADVKHYIVEYFRDVWEVWLKAKTTKETQVTIDDLIPGSRYKFRIKAENSYGMSDPGDESDPFDVGEVSSDRSEINQVPSWVSPEPPEIEVTPGTPSAPKRKLNMAKAKEMWGSDDLEEDILDRFLKVKKFQENSMPSYESDGLPSMVDIEEEEDLESVNGDRAKNARRIYSEILQLSNDTTQPDLESISEEEIMSSKNDLRSSKSDLKRARELYEELRQMSVDTGGSIENLIEGISTSNESISSIIPLEKRQELTRFEMTLKQMIEEAKQMAKSPTGSEEDLYQRSQSANSMADSVVSVIERRKSGSNPPYQQMMSSTPSPPMQEHYRPPSEMQRRSQVTPSPRGLRRTVDHPIMKPQEMPVMVEMPPPAPQPMSVFREKEKPKVESLVGSDRYEEIIEARTGRRSSSVLSGTRSVQGSMTNLFQPGLTMAMREESKALSMSRTSFQGSLNKLNDIGSSVFPKATNIIKDGLGASQPSGLNHLANKLQERPGSALGGKTLDRPKSSLGGSRSDLNGLGVKVNAVVAPPAPVIVKKALNASQSNQSYNKPIEPSIDPVRLEYQQEHSRKGMMRTSYPDWLIITFTYSSVFIMILLLSNIIPNGKLFIHFTAFWSLIIYFIMDDVDNSSSTDVLETIMENFVKVKK